MGRIVERRVAHGRSIPNSLDQPPSNSPSKSIPKSLPTSLICATIGLLLIHGQNTEIMTTNRATALFPIDDYRALRNDVLSLRIRAVKRNMGHRLLILAHHFQFDDVIAHADLRGDSLQLCQQTPHRDCEAIVFCGDHCIAETIDIVTNAPDRLAARGGRRISVIVPDLDAGSSRGPTMSIGQLESTWNGLSQVIETHDLTPVTTISSATAGKAFCGRHGGIVCSSSNASRILKWAFEKNSRVLFFPDQNLGCNTALAMGIPDTQISVWDPHQNQLGGNTRSEIEHCRMILSKGPGDAPLVQKIQFPTSDVSASSSQHGVQLAPLCWSLENLAAHAPVNIIKVDDETQRWSWVALQRMLDWG